MLALEGLLQPVAANCYGHSVPPGAAPPRLPPPSTPAAAPRRRHRLRSCTSAAGTAGRLTSARGGWQGVSAIWWRTYTLPVVDMPILGVGMQAGMPRCNAANPAKGSGQKGVGKGPASCLRNAASAAIRCSRCRLTSHSPQQFNVSTETSIGGGAPQVHESARGFCLAARGTSGRRGAPDRQCE